MRSVTALECALATANGTAWHGSPQGGVRAAIITLLVLGFYAPVFIGFYYQNRNIPTIRYRNPLDMVFTASFAFLFCTTRCIVALLSTHIVCPYRYVYFGIPLQLALLGYVFAELRVVLTFKLTEVTVRSQYISPTIAKLMRDFSKQGLISFPRLFSYFLITFPLLYAAFTQNYLECNPYFCPLKATESISYLFYIEFGFILIGTFIMSFYLSKIVDTFGLRQSFQLSGRIFILLYCIYVPILSIFYDSSIMNDYYADLFMDIIISHVFIFIHIILPLRQTPLKNNEKAMIEGTAGLLDAYLRTEEGYRDFSAFAKSDLVLECVIALKNIMDYRMNTPGHLTATEIFQQHLIQDAPISIGRFISVEILKRYQLVFAAKTNYHSNPTTKDVGGHDKSYYDPLMKEVQKKLIKDTLPRFQRHPFGDGWHEFLKKYNLQLTLDNSLFDQTNSMDKPVTHKKLSIGWTKTKPRLVPTGNEGNDIQQEKVKETNI